MKSTRLATAARPVVVFDVMDKEHRKQVFTFLKTGSWARSPVRFVHKDGSTEQLPAMIGDLVQYYAGKEFRAI